jgi:hypothetical protein
MTAEVRVYSIIGSWPVEVELDAEQLDHITSNVRQQPGFVHGYWGREPGFPTAAHAVVVFEDEATARMMADAIGAAIPDAALRIVEVLAEA